jgi:hypothetical protein
VIQAGGTPAKARKGADWRSLTSGGTVWLDGVRTLALDQTVPQIGARPKKLTVSYDEGRTWQRATTHDNLLVDLTHPAGATSVSLRASATDHGTTVEQTIIRAYLLR